MAITLAEPAEHRLLDNIEKATERPISIEPVPSVSPNCRPARPLTASTVRQAIEADDLDDYGELLGSLADDGDLRSIALALQARPRGQRGDGRRGLPPPTGRRSLRDGHPRA